MFLVCFDWQWIVLVDAYCNNVEWEADELSSHSGQLPFALVDDVNGLFKYAKVHFIANVLREGNFLRFHSDCTLVLH